MKKITILLVIIFTFLFSTTSWGEWSYVTEDVKGVKNYYDKDRVRKSGKYLYFWELSDYPKPNEYRKAIQFLASETNSYMTGQTVIVDGGRTTW